MRGFTLLEMVLVMVLVGTLAALGGGGLMEMMRGRVMALAATALAQKAQLALARLAVELQYAVSGGLAGNGTGVTVTSRFMAGGGTEVHAFGLAGTELRMDGILLCDGVADFQVRYCSAPATCGTSPNASTNMVQVALTLAQGGITRTFTTRVIPHGLP